MTHLPLVQAIAWPAAKHIRAYTTTRKGGFSQNGYASLNLGLHVKDDDKIVLQNRQLLSDHIRLPHQVVWLDQLHGTRLIEAPYETDRQADASWTSQPQIACVVMTADCLPILLTDRAGSFVAALHVGWRGLASGIIEKALHHLPKGDLMAWLGPCIGKEAFVVGQQVYDQLIVGTDEMRYATRLDDEKWQIDLFGLTVMHLFHMGVEMIFGEPTCTFSHPDLYFSHRRDPQCGRMASFIWIES